MDNRLKKPTVASRGQQNHAATAGGPSDSSCGQPCCRRPGFQMVVPRKGAAKVEKEVWGKRCPSQRVASEATLDITRIESKGYRSSGTVMMIKVLLNKLCQSPASTR